MTTMRMKMIKGLAIAAVLVLSLVATAGTASADPGTRTGPGLADASGISWERGPLDARGISWE